MPAINGRSRNQGIAPISKSQHVGKATPGPVKIGQEFYMRRIRPMESALYQYEQTQQDLRDKGIFMPPADAKPSFLSNPYQDNASR
jgi:hypothetical protein